MRICIDLDGTLCELKRPDQTYADVAPIPGAAERVRELRAAGHEIIIQTARHMRSCHGDVGKVVARVGAVTLDWLERNGFEYDEIYFGKPNAELYIDDRSVRFETWQALDTERLLAMARSK